MQLETLSSNFDAIRQKILASTQETITLVKQHAQKLEETLYPLRAQEME